MKEQIESKIVDKHVEKYVRSLIPVREEYYTTLEQYARLNNVPIIQPEVAKFIEVLIKTSGTKSILEIGTAIGYSASLFADAMGANSRLVTIELRENSYEIAKTNIAKRKFETDFEFLLGDGRDLLETIDEKFDMIFIDAAKGHYQVFYDLCIDKLKKGGIIVSDNVLYKGMIATDEYVVRRQKTIVKRMRDYLTFISDHPNLTTSVIPFGDGVAISYNNGGK
ncbi:MAG: O-methyltransferase [Acidaminobacteraceae bacterium]